jgi:hypothetical protein
MPLHDLSMPFEGSQAQQLPGNLDPLQLVDKLDIQSAHNQTEYLRVKSDNY